MNSVNLLGNLTRDVEVKTTSSGKSVAKFSLAVKRPFTVDTTDFFTIVAWDKTAEYIGRYGIKGAYVAVSGALTTRTYENKSGAKVTLVEVKADDLKIIGGSQHKSSAKTANDAQESPLDDFDEILSDDGVPF